MYRACSFVYDSRSYALDCLSNDAILNTEEKRIVVCESSTGLIAEKKCYFFLNQGETSESSQNSQETKMDKSPNKTERNQLNS